MASLADKNDSKIIESREYKLVLARIQKDLIFDIKNNLWNELDEKLKAFNTNLNEILTTKCDYTIIEEFSSTPKEAWQVTTTKVNLSN